MVLADWKKTGSPGWASRQDWLLLDRRGCAVSLNLLFPATLKGAPSGFPDWPTVAPLGICSLQPSNRSSPSSCIAIWPTGEIYGGSRRPRRAGPGVTRAIVSWRPKASLSYGPAASCKAGWLGMEIAGTQNPKLCSPGASALRRCVTSASFLDGRLAARLS